jgi:hypothetical protein
METASPAALTTEWSCKTSRALMERARVDGSPLNSTTAQPQSDDSVVDECATVVDRLL